MSAAFPCPEWQAHAQTQRTEKLNRNLTAYSSHPAAEIDALKAFLKDLRSHTKVIVH